MLEGIEGVVSEKRESELVLKTNGGIYFRLNCTPGTLKSVSEDEKVYIRTYLAFSPERPPELYGFKDREEAELFSILIKANKIGPRSAMRILSATTTDKLRNMLASKNVVLLAKLPGLGKKTAERLVADIGDQVTGTLEGESVYVPSSGEEALQALLSLGFDENMARSTVSKIAKMNPGMATQELLKNALKEMKK